MVRTNSLFKPFQYVRKAKDEKQNFDCILCQTKTNEATLLVMHLVLHCKNSEISSLRPPNFALDLNENDILQVLSLTDKSHLLRQILMILSYYRCELKTITYKPNNP